MRRLKTQRQRNGHQGHSHDGEEIDLLVGQVYEGMVVDKHQPEGVAGGSAPTQNQGGHGQREEGEGDDGIDDGIQIEMFGQRQACDDLCQRNQPDGQALEQPL